MPTYVCNLKGEPMSDTPVGKKLATWDVFESLFGPNSFLTTPATKVARTAIRSAVVDTCFAPDIGVYETAVQHPSYDGGNWVIVEHAADENEAKAMHQRWVDVFSGAELPEALVDVNIDEEFTRRESHE